MSFEDYLKSDMRKAVDKLEKIISKSVIDWDLFDHTLTGLPDINTRHEEDTILSELYHYCPDGTVLIEITKRFLANGYDVRANDGLNGSQCLHNLCWATFDRYILDAAKLLLEAGARTDLPLDMDERNIEEDEGVKESISWRLSGDWVEGNYTVANIFEAYWTIIEAFEAGNDYHSISSFEDCIGESFIRAGYIPSNEEKAMITSNQLTFFDGQIVLWFGKKPLVISKYIDFVVNPLVVGENKGALDCADTFFKPLLNAKLTRFFFIDQCTAQLLFDNGMCLLLSSIDYRDKENRRGFFEIRNHAEDVNILNKQIRKVVLTPGKTYSDSCREFGENSIALFCDNEAFLLHGYPEGYSRSHEIRIVECSQQFISAYKRSVVLPDLVTEKTFSHNRKLAGIRMSCGSKYFNIFVDSYQELKMKLCEEPITSYKGLPYDRKSEKLEFHVDPPDKYGAMGKYECI